MLELNKDNFQKEVLESNVPVLVDFWATWCGPCQMMLPIVHKLAEEMAGQPYKIGTANVDEVGEISEKYGVMSVPTFILFKNGQEVGQLHGSQAKEKLESFLKS